MGAGGWVMASMRPIVSRARGGAQVSGSDLVGLLQKVADLLCRPPGELVGQAPLGEHLRLGAALENRVAGGGDVVLRVLGVGQHGGDVAHGGDVVDLYDGGVVRVSRAGRLHVDRYHDPPRRVVLVEQRQRRLGRGRRGGVLPLLVATLDVGLAQRRGHGVRGERRRTDAVAGDDAAETAEGAGDVDTGAHVLTGFLVVFLRPRGARCRLGEMLSTSSSSDSVTHCPSTSRSGSASRSPLSPKKTPPS